MPLQQLSRVVGLLLCLRHAAAFSTRAASLHLTRPQPAVAMQHTRGWDGFGKGPFKFYNTFDEFMTVFPQEDRDEYPEMFTIPKGCYEVTIDKPLGIAFEEVVAGMPKGVCVDYLVEGSNAENTGVIQSGDVLIAVTAAKEFGPRWERKLLPTIDMEFDIIMSAIGSNSPRYHSRKKNDVVCLFMRPADADEAKVREFLTFFNIPSDHVFRTG